MELELKNLEFLFEDAGISAQTESPNIGRDLHYTNGPKRTVVVQFAETDFPENIRNALESIFSIDVDWFWVNRFGSDKATKYSEPTHSELAMRLIQIWPQLQSIRDDIYLVSGNGEALLSFGHHMREDGMPIFFNDIENASLVISKLNSIGAEFEVFSSSG
jgi:hypothetical protein